MPSTTIKRRFQHSEMILQLLRSLNILIMYRHGKNRSDLLSYSSLRGEMLSAIQWAVQYQRASTTKILNPCIWFRFRWATLHSEMLRRIAWNCKLILINFTIALALRSYIAIFPTIKTWHCWPTMQKCVRTIVWSADHSGLLNSLAALRSVIERCRLWNMFLCFISIKCSRSGEDKKETFALSPRLSHDVELLNHKLRFLSSSELIKCWSTL